MPLKPCTVCGTPTDGSRCAEHPTKGAAPKLTAPERGYDHAWKQLSRRARRMQPFCVDCGAVSDLQADHSPEAWKRKALGLPVRLQDVDVVCGPCNRARGAARGVSTRPGGHPRSTPVATLAGKPHTQSHTPIGYSDLGGSE